jgi:hypothetical protein
MKKKRFHGCGDEQTDALEFLIDALTDLDEPEAWVDCAFVDFDISWWSG